MKKKTTILLSIIFFFLFTLPVVKADSLTDYNVTFHENGGSSVFMSSSYDMSYVLQEVIDPALPFMSETETSILFEVGYVNSDTDSDIVFSIYQNQYLGWVENNGDSTYALHYIDSISLQLTSLKLYDIDLDGDLDIIGVSSYNFVVIYYNDGSGNFTSSWMTQLMPLNQATDLEIGLVGDDMYPDIVVNSTNDDQVLCFFQTSLNTFSTETVLYSGNRPYDIVLNDIDLDGDQDIAVSLYEDNQVIWVENNGFGVYSTSHIIDSTEGQPTQLEFADFDNDGDKDLISLESGNIAASYFKVYINNGNQTFTSQEMYHYSSLVGGTFYDIDQNGYLDFIETLSSSIQTSLFNSTNPYDISTMEITTPSFIKFADIDGDLEDELIISTTNDLSFHVYNLVPTGYVLGYSPSTEKADYDFVGWYRDSELTNQISFPYTLTEDTDLYASWTPHSYAITYHLDGGVNSPQNPASYTTLDTPLTLENPTKAGYSFMGWYLDNTYTGNTISSISTGEEELKDYDLYALWTEVEYSLTFEDNEGNTLWTGDYLYQADLSSVSYPDGDKLGYVVSGWSSVIPSTMPSHDVVITANYSLGDYYIYFDTGGGSLVDSIHQYYGYNIYSPSPDPTFLGYDFGGFYTDLTYTTLYVFTTMPGEDITLYAKWTPHEYQITYSLIGGENDSNNPSVFTIEETLDLFDPSRVGFRFAGFYLHSDFTGGVITDTSTFGAADVTLYANWFTESYTVTFYEFDQTTILGQYTIYYMDDLTSLQSVIPSTVDGYMFTGWNTQIPATMPSNNLDFYPIFVENSYTITYLTNGGNSIDSEDYEYLETLNLPIPIKQGYSFIGWYLDASLTTAFDLTTMPDEHITLYAAWQEILYTFYFSVNGVNFELELPFGSTVPWLDDPTKTNYEFVGWYLDDTLIDTLTFTMPDRNITVVAMFIDETAPIVNGVSDNEVFPYGSEVTITFNEGTAVLNDHPFASGTVIKDPGSYTLTVTDVENNVTTLHFTIEDQTPFSWWYILLILLIGVASSTGLLFKKEIARLFIKK